MLTGPMKEATTAIRNLRKQQQQLEKELRGAQDAARNAKAAVTNKSDEVTSLLAAKTEAENAVTAARTVITRFWLWLSTRNFKMAEAKLKRLQVALTKADQKVADLIPQLQEKKTELNCEQDRVDRRSLTVPEIVFDSRTSVNDATSVAINPEYRERLHEFDDL
jgi:chromosome segregation ATPase